VSTFCLDINGKFQLISRAEQVDRDHQALLTIPRPAALQEFDELKTRYTEVTSAMQAVMPPTPSGSQDENQENQQHSFCKLPFQSGE
jgi:hypothetical protein